MFKYLGQHIFDFVSKFRNDVYFQNLEELDQNFSIVVGPDGKLSKSKSPAEKSIIEVRNDEGSVIPAGAPLYSKGEIGGSDRIKVGICDASDPAKMPCIGIAQAEMNTSDTKDNFAITQGVYNTNISGFTGLSEGDTLYVNGGSAPYLTSTKPSNGNYIQNVGIVLKTNGTICQGLLVSAIGRTNDVPWPLYVDVPNSRVGIGTTSPSEKLHVEGNAFIKNNLHVEGDLTIGKISNNSALLDVGGNFNFDTVAEVSTTDALNFVATIQNVAGNIDNGSHTYHIVYKTADGGETGAYNSVLFKTITIVDNTTAGQVQLTGIPTSPDPRVIARDIYRTQANQSPYYGKKLATINDNTTTTYTDNSSDSALDQNTLFYRKANSTAGYFYKDNNLFAQAGNAHYTSFGVSALQSVTIGQDNVAFGGSALQNTTTGRENTAVGYSTGVNNTTGYGNTYLGYVAGYNNQTGQRNTAVGSFALRQATLSSASYNTAVGQGALWKLTSNNNHNTALGHAAGQGYQGLSNVHIGSYTGYKSTEGSGGDYNINIGYYTGNDTTGDNNILIGRQLQAPNSSGNNQLNIGNLIYATGLGLGTNQGTGNVGIGTTLPSEKLHVVGNIKASGTIKGKMEQMFACSFSDDLGTTKHYLPFTSNAEQTNVHADQAAMVMPYGGRVKCIQMRLSNIDGDTTRTFGVESIAPGVNMYAASNNWTIEETEAYELSADDDFYLVNYVFSNETHFDSGDLLAISIQDTEDAYTASRQTYVTVIIEYDLNNGMGNDTATTKYTS